MAENRIHQSKANLLRELEAARIELLTAMALIPVEERETRHVTGNWTLKDVVGHIADWEAFSVEVLRGLMAGVDMDKLSAITSMTRIEEWNLAHARTRQGQVWDAVWNDFTQTRREMMDILHKMSPEELEKQFYVPWDEKPFTPLRLAKVWIDHDREHAAWLVDSFSSVHA